MKKIAFFTPSLKAGGIERVFLTYAETLNERDYEIYYLTCHSQIEMGAIPRQIKIVTIGNSRLRKSIFQIAKYFKKNEFDVVITGGDISNFLLILIFNFFRIKSKLIISHHNYFNNEMSTFISKLIIKYFYNYAFKTIAVSNGIKEMLLKHGVKQNKLVTLYNPINIPKIIDLGKLELDINLPAKYIVFVGRLCEVKNLYLLIDSYNILQNNNPEIELVIVGDGPLLLNLKEKTKKMDLTHKIHFLGMQSNPFPIIKKSSAVILPSFSEALPTVILEAFIFDKTIVSTPTKGALDLLENGLLGYISNSFDNPENFAKTMNKALLFPISQELIKLKADKFIVNKKTDELITLFED